MIGWIVKALLACEAGSRFVGCGEVSDVLASLDEAGRATPAGVKYKDVHYFY